MSPRARYVFITIIDTWTSASPDGFFIGPGCELIYVLRACLCLRAPASSTVSPDKSQWRISESNHSRRELWFYKSDYSNEYSRGLGCSCTGDACAPCPATRVCLVRAPFSVSFKYRTRGGIGTGPLHIVGRRVFWRRYL